MTFLEESPAFNAYCAAIDAKKIEWYGTADIDWYGVRPLTDEEIKNLKKAGVR